MLANTNSLCKPPCEDSQKPCIYRAIQFMGEYEGLHSSILAQIRVPYIYLQYEFPRMLRLLLPPVPNCNMLQNISPEKFIISESKSLKTLQKYGTTLESHLFLFEICLVISQAMGFSYTNSTTNSLATQWSQQGMVRCGIPLVF